MQTYIYREYVKLPTKLCIQPDFANLSSPQSQPQLLASAPFSNKRAQISRCPDHAAYQTSEDSYDWV